MKQKYIFMVKNLNNANMHKVNLYISSFKISFDLKILLKFICIYYTNIYVYVHAHKVFISLACSSVDLQVLFIN